MKKKLLIGDSFIYQDYDKIKPKIGYSPRIGNYQIKVLGFERDNVICKVIKIYEGKSYGTWIRN